MQPSICRPNANLLLPIPFLQGTWQATQPVLVQSPQIDVETLQEHFHLPITGAYRLYKLVSCMIGVLPPFLGR